MLIDLNQSIPKFIPSGDISASDIFSAIAEVDAEKVSIARVNYGNYKHTRGSTPPANPNVGDTWDEVNAQGLVQEWFWNGTYWLSKPCNIHIPFGGLNNYSGITQGQPFYVIGNYNLYLIKYTSCFYSNGNLTNTDYWRLFFNSNFSGLSSLDIKAGNDGETINFVTKTSPLINSYYISPASGYFSFQYAKVNNAPSIGSLTVIVEYCLARPN